MGLFPDFQLQILSLIHGNAVMTWSLYGSLFSNALALELAANSVFAKTFNRSMGGFAIKVPSNKWTVYPLIP